MQGPRAEIPSFLAIFPMTGPPKTISADFGSTQTPQRQRFDPTWLQLKCCVSHVMIEHVDANSNIEPRCCFFSGFSSSKHHSTWLYPHLSKRSDMEINLSPLDVLCHLSIIDIIIILYIYTCIMYHVYIYIYVHNIICALYHNIIHICICYMCNL